jgi:hypothetical protein
MLLPAGIAAERNPRSRHRFDAVARLEVPVPMREHAGASMTTLSAYLQRRGLGPGRRRGDEVLVELEPDGAGTHGLTASFTPVGKDGDFLLIHVRSGQRLPAAARQEIAATCNLWNSRMRLPRAWFEERPGAVDGEVALDGCVPLAAVRSQAGFDAAADAVIAGSRSFWRWVDVHAKW